MVTSDRRVPCALFLGLLLCTACDTASPAEPPLIEVDAAPELVDTDSILYAVRDLGATAEGGIWVLSAGVPFVYRFDPAGRVVAAGGAAGEGPGELLNPWSIAPGPSGGGAVVWDVAGRQIVTFDAAADAGASTRVPLRLPSIRGDIREISYGAPLRMRPYRGGYLIQIPDRAVTQTRDLAASVLVQVSRDGSVLDSIRLDRGAAASGRGAGAVALVPIPLWAVCGGDRLAVFDPTERMLQLHVEGRPPREWRVELQTAELGEEQVRHHLTYLLELEARRAGLQPTNVDQAVNSVLSRHRDRFGRVAPAAVDMLCDDGGRIWLNAFSTAGDPVGYSRVWHVFAPGSAAPLATVRVAPGFRLRELSGNRGVGTMVDPETGIERPAWISLPEMPR